MRRLTACLLTLLPLAHGESGPSDAAVGFLIDIARERVELETDTAIAEGTTREKKQNIRERLQRLSQAVDQGELKAINERIEGELAGVLISRTIDYDPTQIQVHAIAMMKRDNRWLPAPVPSSFENTGISYIPELSEKAEELELWMLRQRSTRLSQLRENIQSELMADIRKAVSMDELREAEPEQIVERFIDACRVRDLPAALACLGGLEDPLPDNWEDVLRFTAGSTRTADSPTEAWRRMTSTACARAMVITERHTQDVIVKLGEFAPFESTPGEPRISIMPFSLKRSEKGLWRINLPSWLLDGSPPGQRDSTSPELIQAFPSKLLTKYKPKSFETPKALAVSLQQALSSPNFEAVLPHMAPAEEDDALATLERAADLWREFRERSSQSPLFLDVREEGNEACALIARFDSRSSRIRRSQITFVYLQRLDDGWSIPVAEPEAGIAANPALSDWAQKLGNQSEAEWLDHLGIAAKLGGIPADSAPNEAEARAAANAWLDAVKSRDPRKILGTVAYFDDDRGAEKLLRTIGHELQAEHQAEILGVHRNGRWSAVSTRTRSVDRSDPPYHLLYPIVTTPQGPRVLAEAALFHADTRSREFLNSAIWNRLSGRLPETAVTELKDIQELHDRLVEETPAR
ncbi:MAG: hypothetical protein AAGI48_01515 [Verrucomicrobiota bacterium]